jgi:dTDP-glucose 4,6-dehydratase
MASGEVVQFGTGTGMRVARVVELVGKVLGRSLEVTADVSRQRPEKSEVRQLVCSAKKTRELLNWQPRVDLETGLRETINWIDAHRGDYRVGQYSV